MPALAADRYAVRCAPRADLSIHGLAYWSIDNATGVELATLKVHYSMDLSNLNGQQLLGLSVEPVFPSSSWNAVLSITPSSSNSPSGEFVATFDPAQLGPDQLATIGLNLSVVLSAQTLHDSASFSQVFDLEDSDLPIP